MQEVIKEFGHDIAELVYWLTDSEEGDRKSPTLMSSGRLARAHGREAHQFADIIDNAGSIREHDWHFFGVWAREKSGMLSRMLEVEGSGFAAHPLFIRAWTLTRLQA